MLVASTCSVKLFKRKQKLKTWRGLANCLQIASAGTIQRTKASFARDVLRFIHRNGYLIVPPSNPPTHQQMMIKPLSGRWRINRWLLTSLLFDTSFTTFRFCLLMHKIATDQKFVAWKRYILSLISYA